MPKSIMYCREMKRNTNYLGWKTFCNSDESRVNSKNRKIVGTVNHEIY